jgi:hypothetical protein
MGKSPFLLSDWPGHWTAKKALEGRKVGPADCPALAKREEFSPSSAFALKGRDSMAAVGIWPGDLGPSKAE